MYECSKQRLTLENVQYVNLYNRFGQKSTIYKSRAKVDVIFFLAEVHW